MSYDTHLSLSASLHLDVWFLTYRQQSIWGRKMYFLFIILTSSEEVSSDFEVSLTHCLWRFLKLVDNRSHTKLPRSLEEEMVNPLGYSYLGNPMDRGAWRVIVHGVTKDGTRLIS